MRRSRRYFSGWKSITAEKLKLTDDARETIRAMADGDGRYLLNLAEEVAALKIVKPLDLRGPGRRRAERAPLYDKSARSTTTSSRRCTSRSAVPDPDAALYWLARMLAGGEQPLYILRRLVRR